MTPLRVGVLVDSLEQPAWIHKILQEVAASTFANLVLAVSRRQITKSPTVPFDDRHGLVYRAYRRWDEASSGRGPNSFEPRAIDDLLGDCAIVYIPPGARDEPAIDEVRRAIEESNPDVLLRFGDVASKLSLSGLAKYGVWSYGYSDDLAGDVELATLREIIEGHSAISSALVVSGENGNGERAVDRSTSSVRGYSARVNANAYHWKAASVILRRLRKVYDGGGAALEPVRDSDVSRAGSRKRELGPPTNSEMLKFLSRAGCEVMTQSIRRRLTADQWIILYRLDDDDSASPTTVDNTFARMLPPKDRFWADPFPMKHGDRYFLFIEEYPYHDRKGFISVIEMDLSGNWKPPRPVLVTEHHLSYPFVFEWDGQFYMAPECAESNRVTLYRAKSFPYEWEPEATLLSDVRAVDPTLFHADGAWWMFANIATEGAQLTDELHLFHAKEPKGPWTPHPRNPVKSDVRSARPAGRLFEHDGKLYRPSQDSSLFPGYAITLNEVERMTPRDYSERSVSKILPNWDGRVKRIHTLNHASGLTVVDCRYRIWGLASRPFGERKGPLRDRSATRKKA